MIEMPVSITGIFDTQIIGAVVQPNVRYHQRIFVAAVADFYREPRSKSVVDGAVGIDVSVVGIE